MVRSASFRAAPSRSAPCRSASTRFAPIRSAPVRLASLRIALRSVAPVRMAPSRFGVDQVGMGQVSVDQKCAGQVRVGTAQIDIASPPPRRPASTPAAPPPSWQLPATAPLRSTDTGRKGILKVEVWGANSALHWLWGIPRTPRCRSSAAERRTLPAADNRDEMNVPAQNHDRSVTVPTLVEGIERSPLLWPLVVAALLMPVLAIATAASFLGLL